MATHSSFGRAWCVSTSCWATLGYCLWKFIAATVNAVSRGPHRFLSTPKGVRFSPSHVDVLRHFFVTSRGLALYVHKWLPRFDRAPRGVFFILHGLGEHGGRYDHVCHGRSDGERMYAQDLTEDFMEFVQHVLNGPKTGGTNTAVVDSELEAHADMQWKDLPRFVLGHSMGGVLVLQLVELFMQKGLEWSGVIVSSAPFWTVPGGGVAGFVKVLARMFPRLQIPAFEFTRNDFEVYKRWSRDELMPKHGATFTVTCDILIEGDRFAQSDNQLAKNFPAPVYMLHGEQDTVTFTQGTVNFFNACKQKDKTINVIPNAVHEVLNLEGNEKIIKDITVWMEARLK
ncbi:hypothetical protein PHYPSEUDO_004671 [Phytophthora pseudosyringae]|uniref:Serine aminopeptidase S33 domain-containing protein n=1 Tax=Phytophthora pseudosyringae TaxID=221518 RepID=A0A8T1VRN8_9STRA|nr:hypothetical protein PHYPSEUDO_004671 [Phytophthora pseudosyringae]